MKVLKILAYILSAFELFVNFSASTVRELTRKVTKFKMPLERVCCYNTISYFWSLKMHEFSQETFRGDKILEFYARSFVSFEKTITDEKRFNDMAKEFNKLVDRFGELYFDQPRKMKMLAQFSLDLSSTLKREKTFHVAVIPKYPQSWHIGKKIVFLALNLVNFASTFYV